MTVTKRVQLPVFPALSVEEQFTVVVPVMKVTLDVWEQVTLRSASTLSVAFEFITTLDDECSPQSVVDVTLEQLRVGASLSKNGDKSNTGFKDCLYYWARRD